MVILGTGDQISLSVRKMGTEEVITSEEPWICRPLPLRIGFGVINGMMRSLHHCGTSGLRGPSSDSTLPREVGRGIGPFLGGWWVTGRGPGCQSCPPCSSAALEQGGRRQECEERKSENQARGQSFVSLLSPRRKMLQLLL